MKIIFLKHRGWRILIIICLSIIAVYVLLVQSFFLIAVYKESHWENHHPISGKLGYYRSAKGGYIYDLATNEILIPSVDWVVEPKGNDSIGIFHWEISEDISMLIVVKLSHNRNMKPHGYSETV